MNKTKLFNICNQRRNNCWVQAFWKKYKNTATGFFGIYLIFWTIWCFIFEAQRMYYYIWIAFATNFFHKWSIYCLLIEFLKTHRFLMKTEFLKQYSISTVWRRWSIFAVFMDKPYPWIDIMNSTNNH